MEGALLRSTSWWCRLHQYDIAILPRLEFKNGIHSMHCNEIGLCECTQVCLRRWLSTYIPTEHGLQIKEGILVISIMHFSHMHVLFPHRLNGLTLIICKQLQVEIHTCEAVQDLALKLMQLTQLDKQCAHLNLHWRMHGLEDPPTRSV